jgi:hypothetical protein
MGEAYKARYAGEKNNNFRDAGRRTCEQCGGEYRSYIKTRMYCSIACRTKANFPLRSRAQKDANHEEIAEAFKGMGATVFDLSAQCFGVPDLLVGLGGRWHLIEIKNTKNAYGRRGLSKSQAEWVKEWRGGPVALVTDVDGALRFARLLAFEPEKLCETTSTATQS